MAENTPVAVKTPERRLNRWDPFAFLEEMREDLERRLGSVWPAQRPPLQGPFGAIPWAPRMDVFEKEGNLVVKAELPGLKKEDIQVDVDDGDLIIKGERKTESETKEDRTTGWNGPTAASTAGSLCPPRSPRITSKRSTRTASSR